MANQRIAVVTGANTGLGFETSLALAREGLHVVLACRSEAKAEEAKAEICRKVPSASLEYLKLDLTDRPGIRSFAESFSAKHDRLDLLINNAGVMGPPQTITQNGVELQFDANHLGHFLLTSLLIEKLKKGDDARVVALSSLAAKVPEADIFFDNLNFEGNYNDGPGFMGLEGFLPYCQSKLANVLFAMELARRFETAGVPITAVTAHPGTSNTDLSRNMPFLIRFLAPVLVKFMDISKPAQGAQSTLLAALGKDVKPGDFYGPTGKDELTGPAGKCPLPEKANDAALAKRLWEVSEKMVGISFAV